MTEDFNIAVSGSTQFLTNDVLMAQLTKDLREVVEVSTIELVITPVDK